ILAIIVIDEVIKKTFDPFGSQVTDCNKDLSGDSKGQRFGQIQSEHLPNNEIVVCNVHILHSAIGPAKTFFSVQAHDLKVGSVPWKVPWLSSWVTRSILLLGNRVWPGIDRVA